MVSSSSTDEHASTSNVDARQLVDGNGIAVGAESTVTINQVPDEAYELTGEVISTLADVVKMETTQDRSENTQLMDTLIKIGLPAAAIAFVMTR